jgi:hypothetical protein
MRKEKCGLAADHMTHRSITMGRTFDIDLNHKTPSICNVSHDEKLSRSLALDSVLRLFMNFIDVLIETLQFVYLLGD